MRSTTTVLVGTELGTGAQTGNSLAALLHLELARTYLVEVGIAASHSAVVVSVALLDKCACYWLDSHGQIVAIDQAHVVEVNVTRLVPQCPFTQRVHLGIIAALTISLVNFRKEIDKINSIILKDYVADDSEINKQGLVQDYSQRLIEGNIYRQKLSRLKLSRLRPHRLRLSRLGPMG